MIPIRCPNCDVLLIVQLESRRESAASCRSCRESLDYTHLIHAGLPSGLIARLMEWEIRSSQLLSDLGTGLDDPQFIKAWKELRDETRSLLQSWRLFIETDADVVAEVFDRMPVEAWTDEAITGWRRQERRLQDLSWYGFLIGQRSDAQAGKVPYPAGAGSEEDREAFRCGFNLAVEYLTNRQASEPFDESLNDLAARYGRPCST